MSDDKSSNEPPSNPRNQQGNGDNNFNWRGLVLLSVAIALIVAAFGYRKLDGTVIEKSYQEFVALVDSDKIVNGDPKKPLLLVTDNAAGEEYISGFYVEDPAVIAAASGTEPGTPERRFRTTVNINYLGDELKTLLSSKGLTANPVVRNSQMGGILLTFLPFIFLILILYFIFRQQMKMAGKGAMSFGKSKAKMLSMDKNKVTFKNVAGVDEAKEEVWEIVEFLRDPKKFQRLGGKIPKGVLLVGSPGTGKTLLARAIAGEADAPFFSISGSDFVEMFVGVGASRVRDMFEQGKKNAPCIIFIDEIDAVGRHRGHGMGGGHDEREQTLNALLVEMDGFDTQEGVIIIAATNRPDVLDPALLRPGRFDRQVTVPLPDVNGREEILRVHAKKVKMAADVNLNIIARGTPGYSGAELANVINEAALLAARSGKKAIDTAELEEARDKVRWGKERRSLALSDKEKENTAYHEAGHAICLMRLDHTEPLHKVTIIPRGPSLGSTMWLPAEDKYTNRKNELLDDLVVAMGGRVAEEIVFGDVTNGAAGDIKQATNIAKKMVCSWGMSDDLGMVEYGESGGEVFLARDINRGREFSEDTAKKIDEEVKQLIDTAYATATQLLTEYRSELNAIAEGLLEYETLDRKHIEEIMEHGSIQNPPSSPTPPAPPAAPPEPTVQVVDKPSKDGDGTLPPDLAGAPA